MARIAPPSLHGHGHPRSLTWAPPLPYMDIDMAMYMRARELAAVLDKLEYGDIRFEKGCTRADIEGFVQDYSESLRSNKPQLKPSYGKISGKKAVGFR